MWGLVGETGHAGSMAFAYVCCQAGFILFRTLRVPKQANWGTFIVRDGPHTPTAAPSAAARCAWVVPLRGNVRVRAPAVQ